MKKFFKRIWAFIKLLFSNPEKWIEDNVLPSIELVNKIKSFVDSVPGQIITTLIPGTWDDILKQKFSEHLSTAILVLSGIENSDYTAFIEWLKTLTPSTRAAVYAKLASKLAKYNAGKDDANVKNNSVDLITQLTYSKIKSGINENDLAENNSGQITGEQMMNVPTF